MTFTPQAAERLERLVQAWWNTDELLWTPEEQALVVWYARDLLSAWREAEARLAASHPEAR